LNPGGLAERNLVEPHLFNHHHPWMTTIWVITYALWFIPEIVMSRLLQSGEEAQKADRGSKAVVIAAVNVGVTAGFFATYLLPSFSVQSHWKETFAAGITVWVCGLLFRWYSIYVLGRFFTFDVAISAGQHVVELGPYRWIRHPAYLGGLLAMVGFGLTLTNWMSVVLAVCCLLGGYAYRIPLEEKALTRGLGPAYTEYMGRTWRLVPFIF
jgi:protein-S-isoprenylcysteine O-methyltransferase Ste14